MIKFQKLRMKNILSYGNNVTEIDLGGAKTTLVVGHNGAGKSSFIEALTFALYGRSYRSIKKNQLINTINGKALMVELDLEVSGVNYTIRRGIKPNKFEIYKEGEQINQDAKATEYQAMLTRDILKMSFESYAQIVVLGTASYTPFMQLDTPARRAVVEDLIGLEVFSAMNEKLKALVKENKNETVDNKHEIEIAELKLKSQDEKKALIQANTDGKKKDIVEKMRVLMEELGGSQDAKQEALDGVNALSGDVGKVSVLSERMNKLKGMRSTFLTKIQHTAKDKEFFEHNDDCPTCQQAIEELHKMGIIEKVDAKVAKIEDGLAKLNETCDGIDVELSEIIHVVDEQRAWQVKADDMASTIQFTKNTLQGLKRELEEVDTEVKLDDTSDYSSILKELQGRRVVLLKERSVLASSAVLLKDGGIKAKVVSKYIPMINQNINKYLSAMDFFADFNIDEQFNETIRSRFRDEFSYGSFSEGEKSRIDIALMLTWRELAKQRNSVATNLIIMDEVFDGSTDVEGVENIKAILTGEESNIIVISHKTETHESHFDRIITASKVKNFTQLEVQTI